MSHPSANDDIPVRRRQPAHPATATRPGRPPGSTTPGVADADKATRTGKGDEQVRDTPPAGAWNDTSSD
jgi:hypothetical protein